MDKKSSAPANQVVNPFIDKHHKDIMGILHSFDRLRLQGSLRYLYCADIFEEYLSQAKVLYKDFKQFATGVTIEVCQRAERLAHSLKRPFTYLNSSALSKEELARKIAERDGIKKGLVAIFRCVGISKFGFPPCALYARWKRLGCFFALPTGRAL